MGSNPLPSPCSWLCLQVLLLERPIVSDGWTGVDSKRIWGGGGFWSRASHWHVWGGGFISIVPFLARNSKGRAVSTVWVTVVTTKWGLGPVHTGKQGLDAFFTCVMVAIITGFPCRAVLMPSADESGSFPHPSGLLACEVPTGPIVSLRRLSSGKCPVQFAVTVLMVSAPVPRVRLSELHSESLCSVLCHWLHCGLSPPGLCSSLSLCN